MRRGDALLVLLALHGGVVCGVGLICRVRLLFRRPWCGRLGAGPGRVIERVDGRGVGSSGHGVGIVLGDGRVVRRGGQLLGPADVGAVRSLVRGLVGSVRVRRRRCLDRRGRLSAQRQPSTGGKTLIVRRVMTLLLLLRRCAGSMTLLLLLLLGDMGLLRRRRHLLMLLRLLRRRLLLLLLLLMLLLLLLLNLMLLIMLRRRSVLGPRGRDFSTGHIKRSRRGTSRGTLKVGRRGGLW